MHNGRIINGFEIRMEGRSDIGRVRGNNEDYLDWDMERGLAVLADGVGGSNAGEVASRMAVTTLLEQIPPLSRGSATAHCAHRLREAIEHANRRIHESAQYAPFLGMSTTLTALWVCGRQVILAHVGDSRIYRLRNGALTQVTVDHSFVQEMVDSGIMTVEEALNSTRRHLITRALGLKESVRVDIQVSGVRAGDRYLLCSDGLSDMVDEPTLASLLMDGEGALAVLVDTLIEHANQRGGRDNIAALVVAIDQADDVNFEN
ncbi:MAG TPA: Stp1/IreP family PP2C-type Ser/Thr phosphatase [Gammaproteobacteria bacterium]